MKIELAKTEITSLYKKILGRIPDNDGLEFYIKQLRSGKMTLDGVEKILHESDEYTRMTLMDVVTIKLT